MRKFSKAEWIGVALAIVAATVLFFGGYIWNAFFGSSESLPEGAPTTKDGQASTTPPSQTQTTNMQNISKIKGLEIYDAKVGTGAEAKSGQTISAHYVGYLTDGTKFDSSVDRGQPFSFTLGAGQVISGWDQGIVGMKVGGIRRLVISPELGYGANAIGSIPANSTLLFEVQLMDVK